MLLTSVKVALLAAALACYVQPQLLLQPLLGLEQDGADAEASARVMRGLLTLLSYALCSLRPSWFWVLASVAALQLSLWGLQLGDQSIMGLGVETERFLFLSGAVMCFGVIVSIVLFGGGGDNKARFRKRLVAFYTKHNPEKLKEVDDLVQKYELNEELLFARLHRKYNALAAGDGSQSVMKKIDESEFLYEESEEERVESEEEQQEQQVVQSPTEKKTEKPAPPATPIEKPKAAPVATPTDKPKAVPSTVLQPREQVLVDAKSQISFQERKKSTLTVSTSRTLDAEAKVDEDEPAGTPPVSPRTAEKMGLAYARRQSSTLIKDAIAFTQQEQKVRTERRIANIASKSGDGYAGH